MGPHLGVCALSLLARGLCLWTRVVQGSTLSPGQACGNCPLYFSTSASVCLCVCVCVWLGGWVCTLLCAVDGRESVFLLGKGSSLYYGCNLGFWVE